MTEVVVRICSQAEVPVEEGDEGTSLQGGIHVNFLDLRRHTDKQAKIKIPFLLLSVH